MARKIHYKNPQADYERLDVGDVALTAAGTSCVCIHVRADTLRKYNGRNLVFSE